MTEYRKKCKICGKEFISNSSRGEYCSDKCRNTKIYTDDHVGEKWGELIIISAYRIRGNLYATCECSCGNICNVRYDSLKSGNTRSCGHLSKETQFKTLDLAGKINKYGIKAIRPTEKRNRSAVVWECKCTCGKIFEVDAHYFDKIKSCGCKTTEQCRENGRKNVQKIQENYYFDNTGVLQIKSDKIFKTNTSGIRGVYWDKSRNKWSAQIGFKGKNFHLGRYDRKEDAAEAREEAERYLYGDFLKWYSESFPERWKKINSSKK